MKPKINILLISSVVPDEMALGGQLVLKRHLDDPRIGWKAFDIKRVSRKERLYRRLRHGRFGRYLWKYVDIAKCLSPLLPDRKDLDAVMQSYAPDVILTVAHGWEYLAAQKTAKRWKVPLIMILHDWWPDKDEVADFARGWVERKLRATCAASRRVLCVSEGMREEIGKLSNSSVLYPHPATVNEPLGPREKHGVYRILYSGNLHQYGAMLESAVVECMKSRIIRLDVCGPEPWWSVGLADRLRVEGIYHGLIPPNECLRLASTYDAALITMPFELSVERLVRTCFPSKLVEMAQLGIPLVIWGPEYCSAVQWARNDNAALCVTEPSPTSLRLALETLAMSTDEQARLARATSQAADNEFCPNRIHEDFVSLLAAVLPAEKKPI